MEELKDQINIIRNLCDICLLLIANGKVTLYPTVLEFIYLKSQDLLDAYCIKE